MLEDAEDYRQFEATVIADYDAQSAVERELISRLASVLWRLRRATSIETGLFEIQAEHLREHQQRQQLLPNFRDAIHAAFEPTDAADNDSLASQSCLHEIELKSDGSAADFTRCFLRLTNLPNFALDRLSRYEARLWRQATLHSIPWIAASRRREAGM